MNFSGCFFVGYVGTVGLVEQHIQQCQHDSGKCFCLLASMDRIVYTKYKFDFDIYIYKKDAYEFYLELLHAALVVLAGADAADSAGDHAVF